MSFADSSYLVAGTNGMLTSACKSCNCTVCQCYNNYTDNAPYRACTGACMSPSSPASQSSQYILPPQQMEDCYTAPAPQGAGAFPHYNGSEEFQYCSEHGGRAMNPDLVNTFRAGIYAYGQNNELETRSEEELAALNHSFIQANDAMTPSRDPVFEPMDDLITDGTIDPSKLSLPLLKEKVPCPECGILLKDEKSVSRHRSRKHNPNVEYFDCQEYDCPYRTQKKADLLRHARSRHSHDVDPKPYKCYMCGVGSSRKDNLKRHETTCSRNAPTTLLEQY